MDIKKITEKITLPIAMIVVAVISGVVFYAVQYTKQQSIEKQQILKLEQDKATEVLKLEQAKKEYIAERKADCLNVYKTEADKWNNVLGWRYSETDEQCFIRYKDPNPKSDAKCDEIYPVGKKDDFDWGTTFFFKNLTCKEGEFENAF